ncbi:MAG: hypothetical protein NTW96_15010 [Planctomycetia bacterium]|nr:hypothetical protein [Planctomycetia bacterium]
MSLFRRDKSRAVRNFVLNLVNSKSLDSRRLGRGPRSESRVNLTMVVTVVPLENHRPCVDKSLVTVTREFSSTGVSVVLAEPRSLDDVILVFSWNSQTTFVRARVKHLSPMGAGFFQLGLLMTEIVAVTDYPELETLHECV